MYNEGISKEGEVIALGEKMELLTKSGNSYKYGETTLGRGYDATRQFLKENTDVREELLTKIRARLSEGLTVGKSTESKERAASNEE
jgi:recombination protein RecA